MNERIEKLLQEKHRMKIISLNSFLVWIGLCSLVVDAQEVFLLMLMLPLTSGVTIPHKSMMHISPIFILFRFGASPTLIMMHLLLIFYMYWTPLPLIDISDKLDEI